MTAMVYQNFDLSIEASSSDQFRYRARVASLTAGQASSDFTLPFSAQDLEILFLRLGRPRRGVRAIGSPEMQAAQAFGCQLFATVFTGPVQSALVSTLALARQQGQGVRIRLRLTDAPVLADLPWEFLYDPTQSHFLAYSTVTPLVRYLDLPHTVAPLTVSPPLKMLVMIANPRDHGYATLDVEEEWRKVQGALAGLEARGLVQVTRLEAATLSALQRQLRRDQYHIFHFVGHGGFDNQTQNGVLLLEDEQGRSRLVSGRYLGALLRDHFSLRLALLNACEGARTSRADPFAGVAQHLVQQGIPAVIAMQFEITDQAAIMLSHEFYSALADSYPVDAALAEARKALFTNGNDVEWATPVLYLRTQDGVLFEVHPEEKSKNKKVTAHHYTTFLAAHKLSRSMLKWPPSLWRILLSLLTLLGVFLLWLSIYNWAPNPVSSRATPSGQAPTSTVHVQAPDPTFAISKSPSVTLALIATISPPTSIIPSSTLTSSSTNPTVPTITPVPYIPITFPLFLTIDTILTYQQIEGKTEWIENSKARFQLAQWRFDANGSFTFAPVDARDDLYPLTGKYSIARNIIRFAASYSAPMNNSITAFAEVEGRVDLNTVPPQISLNWVNRSDTSAIINNTPFTGGGSASNYEIVATMKLSPNINVGSTEVAEIIDFLTTVAPSNTVQATSDTTQTTTLVSLPTSTSTPHPTPTLIPDISATKVVTLPSGLAMTFVYVPGGEFLMGSTEAQVDAAWVLCKQYYSQSCQGDIFTDELQQHTVSVKPFWIMQTEVTNAQYRAFITAGGYENETFWGTNGWQWRQANQEIAQPAYWNDERFKGDEQPVVGVSWYEAMAYARWLAAETTLVIHLPTEAQWEKAARGPEGLIFPWGNAWDSQRANYCDKNCEYDEKDESEDDGHAYTAPVGSYVTGVSSYGALDLAGNVWEWTSSLDMRYPYQADDGREDETATARRVVRGGSWYEYLFNLRSTNRYRNEPVDRYFNLGFRLVVAVASR